MVDYHFRRTRSNETWRHVRWDFCWMYEAPPWTIF